MGNIRAPNEPTRGNRTMDSLPGQLSWAQSFAMVAFEAFLALTIWFMIWCLFGLAFLSGIRDTYTKWDWDKFSIFLFFWAAWSVWLDVRTMRRNSVDSRGK